MKAIQFLAEKGIEEAKRVLGGAPENAQRYSCGKYMKQGEWTWWWSNHVNKWLQFEKNIYSSSEFDVAVELKELKQVVESLDTIDRLFGLDQAKHTMKIAKEIGYISDYEQIKRAIADYELVESYKGGKK